MYAVGDLVHTSNTHYTHPMVIRISAIIADTHYELETDKGIGRCHIRSIKAQNFLYIASLDEARRPCSEYVI